MLQSCQEKDEKNIVSFDSNQVKLCQTQKSFDVAGPYFPKEFKGFFFNTSLNSMNDIDNLHISSHYNIGAKN